MIMGEIFGHCTNWNYIVTKILSMNDSNNMTYEIVKSKKKIKAEWFLWRVKRKNIEMFKGKRKIGPRI